MFLNGFISVEVFMEQPKGLEDSKHPNHVYKLIKELYGLKKTPIVLYEGLFKFLLKQVYIRGNMTRHCSSRKRKD